MITYLTGMVKLLIMVAGVLAVIMIMLGGIQYMSSDAISGKEEGKEKITQALFGLLLAIASWLILNTINPDLLIINPTIKPAELPSSSTSPPLFPPPGGMCYGNLAVCEQSFITFNNGGMGNEGERCGDEFENRCSSWTYTAEQTGGNHPSGAWCFLCLPGRP